MFVCAGRENCKGLCQNGGTCVAGGTCVCRDGWTGDNCTLRKEGERGAEGREGWRKGGKEGVREGEGGKGRGCELGEMCAVLRVEGGDACANDC